MSEASFASLGPTLLARKGGAKPAMRPQLAPMPETVAPEQLEDLGWNDMGEEVSSDEDGGHNTHPHGEVIALRSGEATQINDNMPASPIVVRQQRRLEERLLADAALGQTIASDNTEAGSADYVSDRDDEQTPRPALLDEDNVDNDADHIRSLITYSQAGSYEDAHIGSDVDVMLPAVREGGEDETGIARARRLRHKARKANARAKSASAGRRAAFTLRLDPERHLKLRLASTMQGVSAQSLVTEALDAMLDEIDNLDALVERMNRTH